MKLKTGTAILIMLCLCLIAVGVGTWRGWREEEDILSQSRKSLDGMLAFRVECAYDLLTVAFRHVDETDENAQKVLTARTVLEDQDASLQSKAEAAGSVLHDGQRLLDDLAKMDSVQKDERDRMYVQEYLPQMLSQSDGKTGAAAYDQAVREYNARLTGTFSGFIARLMGFHAAEEYPMP